MVEHGLGFIIIVMLKISTAKEQQENRKEQIKEKEEQVAGKH